jgi:predicted RNase H-like nuclease (RuvC/YqgF family)
MPKDNDDKDLDNQDVNKDQNQAVTPDNDTGSLSEDHKKLLQAMVDEQLQKMKKSVDKMAAERDQAVREKARLEEAAREAKVKQLEEDGKIVESLEMKLTAEKERATILQERLDKVTRDNQVSAALRGIEFRNTRAAELAEKNILDQLVKDKDGNWVHRSGASIADFVSTFFKDEDNEFLLKPKVNQGSGGPSSGEDGPDRKAKRPKSLEGLTGPELLEMARQRLL